MKMGQERSQTRKAAYSPSAAQIHWAAGFIEGEGTFKQNQNGCEGIRVLQVQMEPLTRLTCYFGGAIRKKAASKRPGRNGQAGYYWDISGSRARGVMLTLYSLMSPKRQGQIRRALA